MQLELTGRTALITGASQGIGRAIAERLAAAGCHLHLAARSADDLEQARAELTARYPVTVHCHPLDLAVTANVAALATACGAVDILVNNAGAIPGGGLQDIGAAAWRQAWELKVFGYIDLCRALYPAMAGRGRGVILNLIGIAGGEVTEGRYIAGTAGNAALTAFTRALGGISPADGIRVLGIHPGPTATGRLVRLMERNALARGLPAERWRDLTADLPFGRPAEPAEVADLAAFLVSDRAAYISGTLITIDGGLSARGHLF
jgi:3-oxoacyl-[acyl-carrier protein] reductase